MCHLCYKQYHCIVVFFFCFHAFNSIEYFFALGDVSDVFVMTTIHINRCNNRLTAPKIHPGTERDRDLPRPHRCRLVKGPPRARNRQRATIDSSNNITIGRGAIAARFLPKGELVVPVPFLHLLDRSLFEKLPRDDEKEENKKSYEDVILNYCFGHSQSTLVMCPVTNAVLVNHCSDRIGRFPCGSGGKGPNAEHRWASDSEWDTKTKETLTMTLDDLAGTNYH